MCMYQNSEARVGEVRRVREKELNSSCATQFRNGNGDETVLANYIPLPL